MNFAFQIFVVSIWSGFLSTEINFHPNWKIEKEKKIYFHKEEEKKIHENDIFYLL